MTEELKPCPFCGEQHEWTDDIYQDGYCDSGIVCHRRILIMAELDKKEVAEIFWNTRPIEDQLRSENKRLREALREIASLDDGNSILKYYERYYRVFKIANEALNEVTK